MTDRSAAWRASIAIFLRTLERRRYPLQAFLAQVLQLDPRPIGEVAGQGALEGLGREVEVVRGHQLDAASSMDHAPGSELRAQRGQRGELDPGPSEQHLANDPGGLEARIALRAGEHRLERRRATHEEHRRRV